MMNIDECSVYFCCNTGNVGVTFDCNSERVNLPMVMMLISV
jgi:hypothetical protein